MVDYNRLKQLQLYHHESNHKHNKEEIQTWLSECGDIYGNIKKIKEFFSQSKIEHENLLVNLTRDCWVTDNEIERLFCTNSKVLLALNVKNLNQYSLLMESDKEIIGHS